jgi:protein-tyrosine-phosphatase
MKNYLFVCSMGVSRSPAAAAVARKIAGKKRKKILTENLGLYSGAKISEERISTFDKIFVMNEGLANTLRNEYHYKKPIINLNIADKDDDSELHGILESKLKKYI